MRHWLTWSVAILAGSAIAADWPMGGRSADRNPVSLEKNPPTDWQIETEGKKPRNIKWARRVEGGSYALGGPVVAGGFVWVGATDCHSDPKNENLDNAVLACFRESDGKLLYRYVSPRLGRWQDWPSHGLSGSPLVEGDRLWFCTNRREVICLDLEPLRTGKGDPRVMWKLDMVKEFALDPFDLHIPSHNRHGSPAAYKDFIYVPTGNGINCDPRIEGTPDGVALACLHKDTGKIVWKVNSPGPDHRFGHYASALVVETGGKGQVIHPQGDGWVRSFDAETGKLLWKFDPNPVGVKWIDEREPAEVARNCVMGTPVYAGGRVYFAHGRAPEASGGPGRLFCVDPTKTGDVSAELDDGKGKGKPNPNSALVWSFTKDGPKETDRMHMLLSSIAVHDGFVIAADRHGIVHCFDEKTGKRHWWHSTKATVDGSLLVADGKVYVGVDAGDVHVLELAKVKKVIAKHEFDQPIDAPPVFANGVLYVLTRGYLYAITQKQ